MTRFPRRLMAAATAGAIALTSLAATPAMALGERDRDALGLILGLGTMALIIDKLDDDPKRRPAPRPYYDQRPPYYDPRHDDDRRPGYGYGYGDRDDHRHGPGRDTRISVPQQCVMVMESRGRLHEYVSGRCLKQVSGNLRLPAACGFDIRKGNGRDHVYGRACLEQNGYRIGRR